MDALLATMDSVRAALIINPSSRVADTALTEVTAASERHGWQSPLVLPTTVDQPGQRQADQALAAGVDRLVVAGGDGTVRRVAGVLAATSGEAAMTPIGVMPIGSANLVARNLGLPPHRLDKAADMALLCQPQPLSVGWVRCLVDGSWLDEVPMLVMAGIGRDAQAIANTRESLKRWAGWLAYAESGVHQALRRSIPLTMSLDDGSAVDIEAWSVLIAALPRLPMGILAFPDLRLGDDAFQVMQVALRHPLQWAAVAMKGLAHQQKPVEALRYDRAQRVLVMLSEPSPIQVDGDLISDVEQVSVRLQAGAVRVASPVAALTADANAQP